MCIIFDVVFSVIEWLVFVIFIVVIGGFGIIEGLIIGVILFFLLCDVVVDLGIWYLIGLGFIVIVVMLID